MEIAGIDAEQIVTSLMQIEQRPLLVLQARQSAARTALDAIGTVRSRVDAFRLAAARLADVGAFDRYAATVSDASVVTASVSGTASPASLTFSVDQLARAHGLRSVGTVASASIPVTSESTLAVAAGTRPLGIGAVRAGAGLGVSSFALSVNQASAGATTAGSTSLAASTVIDGSNDSLDVTINGVSRTLTIAAGVYGAPGLRQAVQAAIDATGGGATAALDAADRLSLTTVREGTAADIQVTGGSALAALGHAGDASAHTGTDAVIDIGGTLTTVTQAESGQTVAVDTGAGTLDIVLSGGLRVGDADIEVVSTGDRSLQAVAAAINGAGAGVSAAAVRVDDFNWRLQLSASATGLDAAIAIDSAVFDGIGGMIESSAPQDARIRIGEGAGAYDVEASGNTFTDVLPGVTLTAVATSPSPVTIDVRRDDETIASDVAKLVSAANDLLAEIKVQTRYDVDTRTSGALAGNGTIRRLADQVRRALGAQVVGVAGVLPSSAGIQTTREGSFTFDKATFLSAVADDPAIIERLFGRGGTSSGDAVFASAGPGTAAGAYGVDVTTAATRAESGQLFDGGAAANARVGVRIGAVTATYDVTAGQTATQIIDGLNASIAAAGLDLVVAADGGGLNIRADAWGSGGDFELNTDLAGAGAWVAHAGADVEGTIDGVAAAGVGRRLSLGALEDTPAAGLVVEVAPGVIGPLNAVEYQPGLAARVVELATALTEDETGALTSASEFADRRVEDFNDQIARFEDRLFIREANLRRQWSNLQTLLGGLQNQGDWISGQLATLDNNWGGSN